MSDFESIKRIDEREKITSKEKDEAKDINDKAKTDQIKDEKTDQIKAEQIEDSKSNRKLKEDFSKKLFNYLCVWTACVFLIIIFHSYFRVEKEVLVILVGSTTVSIVSIFHFIVKGLFK